PSFVVAWRPYPNSDSDLGLWRAPLTVPASFARLRRVGGRKLRPPFAPMEALSVEEIPTGSGWQYEPKWDGFRCLVFRNGRNAVMVFCITSVSPRPFAAATRKR